MSLEHQAIPRRRARRWRRLLARTAAAAVLLALAAALSRTLWLPHAIEWLAPRISGRLIPFRISVQEVLAADYDHIAVRGLSLEALAPDESLRRLEVREADARFALLQLLGGDALGAVRELSAREAKLELDLAQPPEPPDEEPPPPLPARVPRLDVADVTLDFALPEGRRVAATVQSLQSADDEHLALDLRAPAWRDAERPFAVERLELNARYAAALFEDVSIAIDGEQRIASSRIDLRRAHEGSVDWDVSLLLPDGSAHIAGGSSPTGLDLSVSTSDVALAPIVALLTRKAAPIDACVDLDAILHLPPEGPSAGRGEAAIRARELAFGGTGINALETELSLGDATLRVAHLHAAEGANEVSLEDAALPLEALDADVLDVRTLLADLRGRVRVTLGDPARLFEAKSELGQRALDGARVALAAGITAEGFELERLQLSSPAGRFSAERGAVAFSPEGIPSFDVAGDFNVEDLGAALAVFGELGWNGALAGRLDARGTWPEIQGAVSISGSDVAVAGVPLGTVAIEGSYGPAGARIDALRASSEALELEAHGRWDRAAGHVEQAMLAVDVPELASFLPHEQLAGHAVLDLRADGDVASLRTRLRVDASDLRIATMPPVQLALAATGDGSAVRLEELALRAGEHALKASGFASLGPAFMPCALQLDALSLTDRGEELLALAEPASFSRDEDASAVELALIGKLGSLRASAHASSAGTDLSLEALGFDPMPVAGEFLPPGLVLAGLDATLRAQVADGELALESEGELAQASVPGLSAPAALSWSVAQHGKRLAISHLEASVGESARCEAHGELPLDPTGAELIPAGPLDLHAQLSVRSLPELVDALPPPLRPQGPLSLEAELGGTAEHAVGRVAFLSRGLALASPSEEIIPLGDLDLLLLVDDAIVLEHGRVEPPTADVGASIEAHGAIGRSLDLRSLARGPAWLAGAPVEGEARCEVPEVARIEAWFRALGLADLPLRSGRLEASAAISGTLARPELSGRFAIQDGTLRFVPELPTAAAVQASIRVHENLVEVEEVRGELGGAPFRIEGEMDLAGESPQLDLTLTGEDLLLHRSRGVKVRANVDLKIEGPLASCLVSGRIALTDARYVRNFEVDLTRRSGPRSGARGFALFRLSQPPLSTMRFDVHVEAEKAFAIKNTTVSGGVRPDLHLRGTGEVPIPIGQIYVEPTTLSLPGSTLKIDGGTLQFREEDPFQPVLALNGGARLHGYDVRIIVTGTIAEPEIVLSSNPPLSDHELLLLVTTGQLPVDGEAASASDTARVVAVYLAKDFLARWLSDDSTDSEESLLSRFEVTSGQDVSKSGAETIWVSFRVTDKAFTQRDKLYLTAERNVYDHYNYGVRIAFRFE